MTYYGAIIENSGEECLEFIAPQNLTKMLHIPEYGRLCFNYSNVQENTIAAFYDSDLFQAIEKLFLEKGKITTITYPQFVPNLDKAMKLITSGIAFSNATFRINSHTISSITYTLVFFKYLALSDEKQEGILSVLINEHNLSTTVLNENFLYIMDSLEETKETSSTLGEKTLKMLQSVHTMAVGVVKEYLNEFIKSLERRLNRDIKRVYEYYEALKEETVKLISKKLLSGDFSLKNRKKVKTSEMEKMPDIKKHIADKSIAGKGIDKLYDKLNAISTEENYKIKDLISKYTLKIDIKPISVVRIETEALQFLIDIKRRMGLRQFSITYNPLLKQIDPLPCEACFFPKYAYYVCDDHLHIICSKCFKTCPECGKRYCSACHKEACPRCGTKVAEK